MFPIVLILAIVAVVLVVGMIVFPERLVPLAVVTLIDLGFAIMLALLLTTQVPVHIH